MSSIGGSEERLKARACFRCALLSMPATASGCADRARFGNSRRRLTSSSLNEAHTCVSSPFIDTGDSDFQLEVFPSILPCAFPKNEVIYKRGDHALDLRNAH